MSDDLATGLAVAGFVLAVVSLTWQFWFTHRVDRARLSLDPPIGLVEVVVLARDLCRLGGAW
jgi:hypothetical protein